MKITTEAEIEAQLESQRAALTVDPFAVVNHITGVLHMPGRFPNTLCGLDANDGPFGPRYMAADTWAQDPWQHVNCADCIAARADG